MTRRFAVSCLPLAVILAAITVPARADFAVAPNANAATPGGYVQFGLLGNGSDSAVTFQVAYAASQFAAVPVGTQITSLGFRLASGEATVVTALQYSQYDIQIGRSANSPGSLSTTFAANQGADTTLVRSGALTIPAGSLIGGLGANPFYDITFATPFTYTGGDLLVTIRWTAQSPSAVPRAAVDSVLPGSVAGTVGNFGGANATTGQSGFYNAPVARFGFAAVPEPSSVVLAGLGLVGVAVMARRRLAA